MFAKSGVDLRRTGYKVPIFLLNILLFSNNNCVPTRLPYICYFFHVESPFHFLLNGISCFYKFVRTHVSCRKIGLKEVDSQRPFMLFFFQITAATPAK